MRAVASGGRHHVRRSACRTASARLPYGAPSAPDARRHGTSGRASSVSWNSTGSDNGRPIKTTQIRIDGGNWQNVGATGSRTVGNGYSRPTASTCGRRTRRAPGLRWPRTRPGRTTRRRAAAFVTRGADAQGQPRLQHGVCAVLRRQRQRLPRRDATTSTASRTGPDQQRLPPGDFDANGPQQLGCYVGTRA